MVSSRADLLGHPHAGEDGRLPFHAVGDRRRRWRRAIASRWIRRRDPRRWPEVRPSHLPRAWGYGTRRTAPQEGAGPQVGASRLRLQGAPNRQRVAPPFQPVFKDEWFLIPTRLDIDTPSRG